jgi:hypothetical protein
MVTLWGGSAWGKSFRSRACPASWKATSSRSRWDNTRLRRCGPAMTRSMASSNSAMVIRRLLRRAASNAASFTRLARSAPEKPGVRLASTSTFTSSARGLPRRWTSRMALRPFVSGLSTTIRRSNRPGRSRAGSRMSGRLVAAMTMIPALGSKPSISTSSWFRVCSRSSWPPPRPAPRWRPTASISSMNTRHGAFFLAWSKRSRTRLAPTPTNISTNSEPEMEKKGTPASPATALARRVLPEPGGPTRSTPRGILAPRAWNFFGCLRNSMISWSSSFASSTPATSSKVTLGLDSWCSRARLLPKDRAWLLPDCACRIMRNHSPMISKRGRKLLRRLGQGELRAGASTAKGMPFWRSRAWIWRVASLEYVVRKGWPSFRSPVMVLLSSLKTTFPTT